MAVPKQKQSHSRTNKRRSTHKISAPAINACPKCHQPRRPHRVCPQLRLLRRARGRARARPRSRALRPATRSVRGRWTTACAGDDAEPPLTIALDANGADAGPAEVARGAALPPPAAAIRVLRVRAGRRDRRPRRRGRGRRRARLDRQGGRSRARGARHARRLDRPGRPGRRRRARRRARVRRLDRRRAGRRPVPRQARPRHPPARRWRCSCPSRASRSCCSTAAPTSRSGPSTSSSSRTWARRSWRP